MRYTNSYYIALSIVFWLGSELEVSCSALTLFVG